jgi:serine/threonine-protein kinase RsbW
MRKEFHSQTCMKIESEEDVLRAMECTDHLAQSLGYLSNEQLLLRLVTEEAVVNALEYSAKDEQHVVEINWSISNKEFVISVQQPGIFFNINKNKEINYGQRGRGVQLILNIMDEVWLEQEEVDTITLHMRKYIQ